MGACSSAPSHDERRRSSVVNSMNEWSQAAGRRASAADFREERRRREAQEIYQSSSWKEIKALGAGCKIEKAEARAIQVLQLQAVRTMVKRRCQKERWRNQATDDWLTPLDVSLYDVYKYVILPSTVERQCSFVEVFAAAPQLPNWFGAPPRRSNPRARVTARP